MPKKFVVSLTFPVGEYEHFDTAENIKHWVQENGYFYTQGPVDDAGQSPTDLTVLGDEMSVVVREVDC